MHVAAGAGNLAFLKALQSFLEPAGQYDRPDTSALTGTRGSDSLTNMPTMLQNSLRLMTPAP